MLIIDNIKNMFLKDLSKVEVTEERGGTGTTIFSGMITGEEYRTELQGTTGLERYDQMRRGDATVKATLMSIILPIRQANWEVEPASDDKKDIEIANIISENLFEQMSITWDDFIRQALLCLPFGFMVFEKVYNYDGKYLLLKKLAPRLPKTIWKWNDAEDGGLEGIVQQVYKKESYENIPIPIEKLLIFTNEREGSNFEGISILRSAHMHWKFKNMFYKLDAINHERFAVGIPDVKLPENSRDEAGDKAKAKEIAANLRSHEQAYIVRPHGFEVSLLNTKSNASRILLSIKHHNEQIALNTLTQFLTLGTTQSGARALGDSFQDMFLLSQQAIADHIAEITNRFCIRQMVDFNWKVKAYPKLKVSSIAKSNFTSLSDAVSKLVAAGTLTNDDALEEHLRNIGRLPAKLEVTEPTKPPEPELPKETCDCPSCGNLKLKELKLENLREPDEIEKCLLLKEIISETERAKVRIVKAIKSVQDEQLDALAKSVARDRKTAKAKKIGLLSSQIKGELLAIYSFGREQVKEEIDNQKKRPIKLPVERTQQLADVRKRKGKPSRRGIVDDQTAKAYIDSKADLVSGQMAKKYENTALFAELEATKQGLSGQAKVAFIGIALRELSDKEAENAARFTVLEAYGMGRNVQAEVQAKDIQFSYYSAIMDENLCEVCAKLDQTVHEFGDPEFTTPNPDCLGGNQCRCVNVYVRKEEERASV
jgi:hypothetical protein